MDMGAMEIGAVKMGPMIISSMAMTTGVTAIIKILVTLLIIGVGALVVKTLCKMAHKLLNKSNVDEILHVFFVNCLKVLLWAIVLVMALDYLGIPPTSLLTVLGAAGVAVALALKDSLGNFAGGILIILSKPFSKGDFIEDLSISGRVEKIDLLYTTLMTLDNKTITIPNGKLANSTIINYSSEQSRRVDCTFSIGYQDDIAKAKEVLLNVTESNPDIYQDPAPIIGVAGHGDNAINLDVRVWCDTAEYWNVFYYLNEQVKLAFDVADISIPYPQMDVHVVK